MTKLLLPAVLGLFTGLVTGGFSLAYAACELGCQESTAWVSLANECKIFNSEQAKDGKVAGDIGTLTEGEPGLIHWVVCPLNFCNKNCPDPMLTVWFQAAGGPANEGCLGGEHGFEEVMVCDNP